MAYRRVIDHEFENYEAEIGKDYDYNKDGKKDKGTDSIVATIGRVAKKYIKEKKQRAFLFSVLGLILMLVGYFYVGYYSQVGIRFEGSFLVQELYEDSVVYSGHHVEGPIEVRVDHLKNTNDATQITFNLPQSMNNYKVEFDDASNWERGMTIVGERGGVIFEGYYDRRSNFLKDKKGDYIINWPTQYIHDDVDVFGPAYQVRPVHIAALATARDVEMRGDGELLMIAIFLTLFIGVDMAFPRFFFLMKHAFSVADPEPSDFFLASQKIAWICYPFIIIVLLLVAVQ